jgi:rhodanese-related sulfurtransferase
MASISRLSTILALTALAGCRSPAGGDEGQRNSAHAVSGKLVRAAGIELQLPDDWELLDGDEPNFALAYRPEQRPTHIPVCTIELRRQGPGALPDDASEVAESVYEYRRGALRGRVGLYDGPDDSTVVVHCRTPRSSTQWEAVAEVFASMVASEARAELPALRGQPEPEAIVELCSGSATRRTKVCARRADGAVYCGVSTGDHLARVELPTPAVQIACRGASACARDGAGAVRCWTSSEPPALVTEVERARDIANECIVDAAGTPRCRRGEALIELHPLHDPAHALSEVDRLLVGSDEASGCVLRQAELWCWGADEPPHRVGPAAAATNLRRLGDRLCVEIDGRWSCTDDEGQRYQLDGCEARPCGCSAIGATRLSCEHEPYAPIDARPFARITNVVAVAEPCAARLDNTVVCRGPLVGPPAERPAPTGIASDLPDIVHTLELR